MTMMPLTTPRHNAHLKVGEKVICTGDIQFLDGTVHWRGNLFTIQPDDQAYFSLFTGTGAECKYLKID